VTSKSRAGGASRKPTPKGRKERKGRRDLTKNQFPPNWHRGDVKITTAPGMSAFVGGMDLSQICGGSGSLGGGGRGERLL